MSKALDRRLVARTLTQLFAENAKEATAPLQYANLKSWSPRDYTGTKLTLKEDIRMASLEAVLPDRKRKREENKISQKSKAMAAHASFVGKPDIDPETVGDFTIPQNQQRQTPKIRQIFGPRMLHTRKEGTLVERLLDLATNQQREGRRPESESQICDHPRRIVGWGKTNRVRARTGRFVLAIIFERIRWCENHFGNVSVTNTISRNIRAEAEGDWTVGRMRVQDVLLRYFGTCTKAFGSSWTGEGYLATVHAS